MPDSAGGGRPAVDAVAKAGVKDEDIAAAPAIPAAPLMTVRRDGPDWVSSVMCGVSFVISVALWTGAARKDFQTAFYHPDCDNTVSAPASFHRRAGGFSAGVAMRSQCASICLVASVRTASPVSCCRCCSRNAVETVRDF